MSFGSRVIATSAPRSVILVRLIVGAVFLSEGIQKFLFPGDLGVGRFIKIGIPAAQVMAPFVGVIEIVAGIGVWFKPRIFAYVVAAWLALIIINLLLIPGYFDIALRDLGLLLGALALGRLSEQFARG